MPFVYTTPVAPAAASIGDLLERRGTIAGNQAINVGNAQAQGQVGAGQAWGQGIAQAGQVAAQAIQQVTSPQTKMAQIQLKEAQDQQRSKNIFEAELKNPANYSPDGSVDSAKIGAALKRQDVGAWQSWLSISNAMDEHAVKLREDAQKIAQTTIDIQGKQQAFRQTQANYLGALAFTTEQQLKAKPDDPLHARDTFLAAVARGVADGGIQPDEGKALLLHTAQATPSQLLDLVGSAVPPQQRSELEGKAATTAKATADAAKAAAETANLQQFGRPSPPESQHVDFQLDGKPVKGSFIPDAQGGKYFYNGQDVTPRAVPIPSVAQVQVNQQESDAQAIADGIEQGLQPPDIKGLYRNAGPVRAELAKRGYDLKTANLDWQAVQKHVATLNGAQQLKLNQSINALPEMLDTVENLADQWKGGQFPILNRANLALAKNGAYGDKAASIATRLDAQIADVTADLGNVYMGGNSPTDHSLELAGKALKSDWSEPVLRSMIKQARTNVQIRKNSIDNTDAAGTSTPPPAASTSAPSGGFIEAVDPQGNIHHAPAGTPLPAGWKLK